MATSTPDSDEAPQSQGPQPQRKAKAKVKSDAKVKVDPAEPAEKRTKSTIKYPPYVNAFGSISKLFDEITKASVPPKVTVDFLESVLDLKSSSHRALIPLMKRLGFLDAANVPTDAYKNFRDASQRRSVMATQVRSAYSDIYRANEYAHNLKRDELIGKLRALLGAAEDDPYVPAVAATFLELVKIADFKGGTQPKRDTAKEDDQEKNKGDDSQRRKLAPTGIGLSYTINLNLPATTEIEVFNAIFKSLREHLLND